MGQGGLPAAGKAGKPDQGTSVTVEAVTVGLLDAALEGEYVFFHIMWVNQGVRLGLLALLRMTDSFFFGTDFTDFTVFFVICRKLRPYGYNSFAPGVDFCGFCVMHRKLSTKSPCVGSALRLL